MSDKTDPKPPPQSFEPVFVWAKTKNKLRSLAEIHRRTLAQTLEDVVSEALENATKSSVKHQCGAIPTLTYQEQETDQCRTKNQND